MSQTEKQYLSNDQQSESINYWDQLVNLKPKQQVKQDNKFKKTSFKWLKKGKVQKIENKKKKKKYSKHQQGSDDQNDREGSRSRSKQKNGKSHHEKNKNEERDKNGQIVNSDNSEGERDELSSNQKYDLNSGQVYKKGKHRNEIRKLDRMFERQLKYYIQGKPKDQLSFQIFNTVQQYFR